MMLQNSPQSIQTIDGNNELWGLYVLEGCDSKAYLSNMNLLFAGGVMLDAEPGSFWLSSIAMVMLLKEKLRLIRRMSVLELGAGSGLPSRFLAKCGVCVTASDCDVIDLGEGVETRRICWHDLPAYDESRYDVLIASDCIYKTTYRDGFLDAIAKFKKEKILLVNPYRDSVDEVGYALQEMFDNLVVETRRMHVNRKYYIDLCVMSNI